MFLVNNISENNLAFTITAWRLGVREDGSPEGEAELGVGTVGRSAAAGRRHEKQVRPGRQNPQNVQRKGRSQRTGIRSSDFSE